MAKRSIQDSHQALAIRKEMNVGRDAYLDYMTFRTPGPPMFTEIFGPLLGLKEEWQEQGATPAELDLSAFRFRQSMKHAVSVNTGWMGGPEPEILEETDEYILGTDRYGRQVKLFKQSATLPLPLTHPVESFEDWMRVKHHYEYSEARFGKEWKERSSRAREEGKVVSVRIPGGFDEPRQLMGEALLCESYYSQPDLIHDILDTIGNTALRVLERVSREIQIDELHVHEDMAGKSGPLAGPRQVTEFLHLYYRKIWDLLQDRGARIFSQDSDGDMNSVIPAFLDAGINHMYPIEPAAGMDMVKIREQYGTRLSMAGGIDKHVIRRSKDEIVAELEYDRALGGNEIGRPESLPFGISR